MPLKYEVKDLADVEEPRRALYIPIEAGGFRLEVNGLPGSPDDIRAAMRADKIAKDVATAELERREQLAAARAEIERLEKLAREPPPMAEPTPRHSDDARLEAETAAKIAEHEAGIQARITSLRADRDTTALERVACEIAAKLAVPGSHELLLPHIAARLVASDAGGVFSVTAKDAPTIEHLVEQFRSNPAFARIITGASAADQARHQQRVNETLGVPAARPTLSREKFNGLGPQHRAAIARGGAEIFDTKEIAK
jgi:hypothetical protein